MKRLTRRTRRRGFIEEPLCVWLSYKDCYHKAYIEDCNNNYSVKMGRKIEFEDEGHKILRERMRASRKRKRARLSA